jgi:hypothetical protein
VTSAGGGEYDIAILVLSTAKDDTVFK